MPGGLAENSQRNREELPGIVKARDVTRTAGGKISLIQGICHQDADAKPQRNRKTNPLAEGGIVNVKRWTKVETCTAGTDGIKKKRADEQSSHHTERQRNDAVASGRHDARQNDTDVIKKRYGGRHQKPATREQYRGVDAAEIVKDLAGQ